MPISPALDWSIIFDEASEFDDIYDYLADQYYDGDPPEGGIQLAHRIVDTMGDPRPGDDWRTTYLGEPISTNRDDMLDVLVKFDDSIYRRQYRLGV